MDLNNNHMFFTGGKVHEYHMVFCCFPCATANGICLIPLDIELFWSFFVRCRQDNISATCCIYTKKNVLFIKIITQCHMVFVVVLVLPPLGYTWFRELFFGFLGFFCVLTQHMTFQPHDGFMQNSYVFHEGKYTDFTWFVFGHRKRSMPIEHVLWTIEHVLWITEHVLCPQFMLYDPRTSSTAVPSTMALLWNDTMLLTASAKHAEFTEHNDCEALPSTMALLWNDTVLLTAYAKHALPKYANIQNVIQCTHSATQLRKGTGI